MKKHEATFLKGGVNRIEDIYIYISIVHVNMIKGKSKNKLTNK